jgi:hypothetical protein
MAAGAAATAASPDRSSAPTCKPARSPRCLRLARGQEPVVVSAAGTISRSDALQGFLQTIGPLPGVKAEPGAVDRGAFQ